jgi:hypothetical protein
MKKKRKKNIVLFAFEQMHVIITVFVELIGSISLPHSNSCYCCCCQIEKTDEGCYWKEKKKKKRKVDFYLFIFHHFFFLLLPLYYSDSFFLLLRIWNRAFIFFFLRSFVIFTLYAKSNEKREREGGKWERIRKRERVNQTVGDVRPWRRTNSIHLGARECIRWHNRNIRNRKSLSLSFFPSFFYMLSQAVFYDLLDSLSLLRVQIIVNLLSSIRVQLYSVVNIFLLFIHQVVLWPP